MITLLIYFTALPAALLLSLLLVIIFVIIELNK